MDNQLRTVRWTVGDRLAKARRLAAMSTQEMADYLGLDRKMINHYEADRTPIRMAYLRLWADKCGVSVEWLLHGDDVIPEKEATPSKAKGGKKGKGTSRSTPPRINVPFESETPATAA